MAPAEREGLLSPARPPFVRVAKAMRFCGDGLAFYGVGVGVEGVARYLGLVPPQGQDQPRRSAPTRCVAQVVAHRFLRFAGNDPRQNQFDLIGHQAAGAKLLG